MFYVYVFKSLKNGDFYKGQTNQLEVRLEQHLKGRCRSTKNMLPIKLVHVEFCDTRLQARKIEEFLKSGYGREIIKEISDFLEE